MYRPTGRPSRKSQWSLFPLFRVKDELLDIPSYHVPKSLINVLKNNLEPNNSIIDVQEEGWINFIKILPNLKDVDESSYFNNFIKLLYLEECYDNNALDDTSKKTKVKILSTNEDSIYKIKLKNLKEELCHLKKESIVTVQTEKNFRLHKKCGDKIGVPAIKNNLEIVDVSSDDGYIIVRPVKGTSMRFLAQHDPKQFYYVEFEYSGWPIRVCHFAIDLLKGSKFLELLNLYERKISTQPEAIIGRWFSKNMESNPEQMQAVRRIVGRTAYPLPYLVFGPPGTGKTATIVEAVTQLYERNHKILICTPSNAAANEITTRLLKHIPSEFIYRMMSKSVELKDVPEEVKSCMSIEGGEIDYLLAREIEKKKIVISTLVSSARFLRLSYFSNHFEFIFIDESGQATQPETFIPFAISQKDFGSQIVMSGDPKQLGPVVMTKHGDHLLGISMLQRLMEKSCAYKKNDDGKYDANFITKLVQNYRSHEAIIRLPNQMFYENELVACAGKEAYSAENWSHLPRRKFPIIFHATHGVEQHDSSHSVANEAEAIVAVNYVEKLLDEGLGDLKLSEDNIGIVTPFRYQKSIITDALKIREWTKISVGTVESFQGQEKDIIIVSLVRSAAFKNEGKYHVGFLSDEKRFNVTITRAKCLLIVIGHPKVLQIDDSWRKFITYCQKNDALCGDSFNLTDTISEAELKVLVDNKIRSKKITKSKQKKK